MASRKPYNFRDLNSEKRWEVGQEGGQADTLESRALDGQVANEGERVRGKKSGEENCAVVTQAAKGEGSEGLAGREEDCVEMVEEEALEVDV